MAWIDRIKKKQGSPAQGKPSPSRESTTPHDASIRTELEKAFQKAFSAESWKEALEYLHRWIEVDPDNLYAHRKVGDVLLKLNRKKEALQKYWEVVQALCAQGQYRQAKALNQVILRLAPKLKQAQKKAIEIEAKLGFFRHPLFVELGDDAFGELVKKTEFRRFPKEAIVIREGEPGRSLFMVCSGAVDVYIKNSQRGIAEQVARLGKHNFFGEGGFLTGKPRSASVLAAEETVLLELSNNDLDEVIKIHPRVREVVEDYHRKRQNPSQT